jgi:hypothetical protein
MSVEIAARVADAHVALDKFRSGEIAIRKPGVPEDAAAKVGVVGMGTLQGRFGEVRFGAFHTVQIGKGQTAFVKVCPVELAIRQIGLTEIGAAKIGLIQVHACQVGSR